MLTYRPLQFEQLIKTLIVMVIIELFSDLFLFYNVGHREETQVGGVNLVENGLRYNYSIH